MPIQYDQIPIASVPQAPTSINPVNKPPSPPPPPHPVKKFLLAEILAAEIIIGIVVIGFIFGLLNYFNIISLSKSFPFLAFLPHQEVPQQIATPFQYNTEDANGQVKQYILTTLKPEFQPADIFATGNIAVQNDNAFTRHWTSGQLAFDAQFSYEPKANRDSYMFLKVSGPLTQPLQSKDTNAVAALFAKFFTIPASSSALLCKKTPTGNTCEQFIDDHTGKSGQAISWSSSSFTISSCYVPRSTVTHAGDTTCLLGK